MGEMRDLLVGVAAFGDVVDDVDDVADLPADIADADPRRGDVALAERLAVPEVLVLEQAARLQRLLVIGGDDFGDPIRSSPPRGRTERRTMKATVVRFSASQARNDQEE